MGIIAAAVIGIAGAVGKGIMAKKGAKKLANAYGSAESLLDTEFQKTEREMSPWRNVGQGALDAMARSLGIPGSDGRVSDGPDFSEFYKSPGYKFRMDEGIKGVERSAASRGSLQSGAAMKAVQRYGEGQASQEYGNYMDQLYRLSGQGAQTAAQLGAYRGNSANNRANMLTGQGMARQSGYNAMGNMIGDVANIGQQMVGGMGSMGTGQTGTSASIPTQIPGGGSASRIPQYR
jgi:hypothetical protein